jgi:hypothetical protein
MVAKAQNNNQSTLIRASFSLCAPSKKRRFNLEAQQSRDPNISGGKPPFPTCEFGSLECCTSKLNPPKSMSNLLQPTSQTEVYATSTFRSCADRRSPRNHSRTAKSKSYAQPASSIAGTGRSSETADTISIPEVTSKTEFKRVISSTQLTSFVTFMSLKSIPFD